MKHTNILKKMLAAFSAAAVGASCLSFSAFAEGETYEPTEYTAFIAMMSGADEYWAADDEGVTPVTFTEDGQYSVSVESLNGSDSIELMLLSTNINLYGYVPEDYTLTDNATLIADTGISIAIDGIQLTKHGYDDNGELVVSEVVDIDYTDSGVSSLNVENDGTSLRKNIYNEWQDPKTTDITNTGLGMNAGDFITVTFTVTGIGSGSAGDDTTGDDTTGDDTAGTPEEGVYTAFIAMMSGADEYWAADDAGVTPVTFTEDGQYSVSVESLNGSDSIELMLLSTNINLYAFVPEDYTLTDNATLIADSGISVTIDSIQLTKHGYDDNGELVVSEVVDMDYTDSGASSLNVENDGTSLRKNIYNEWQDPKTTDITNSGLGMNAGDFITVTFTITGLGDSPYSEVSYGDVDADGTVGLSDASAVLTEYASVAASLGSTFDEAQFAAADVDADSTITLNDASAILSYYAAVAASLNPVMSDYFAAAAK